MKTTGIVVIITGALLCSWAEGKTIKTAQRGNTVSVTMHFNSDIQSDSALLVWETYDDAALKQKGRVTVFSCSGNAVRNASEITIPCKIPPYVADGRYYLVSVIAGGHDYSWTGESSFDVDMNIKGGPTTDLPIEKTIQITAVEASK